MYSSFFFPIFVFRTWYTAGFTIGGVILLMLLTWLLGAAFQVKDILKASCREVRL